MADIPMPRLSDTMEEGTILHWLKQDGDEVGRGDELVEIETDKANMTYESDTNGTLEIVAKEGETLQVGVLIARIGQPAASGASTNGGDSSDAATAASDDAPGKDATAQVEQDAAAHIDEHAQGERVKASPLARRIAKDKGIDLHGVSGSGPGGRIVRSDVEAGVQEPASSATQGAGLDTTQGAGPEATPSAGTDTTQGAGPDSLAERIARAKGETTVLELTRTQQVIARRMAESKATIPHFTLDMEVDMEECVSLRTQLKQLAPAQVPTYNDMVMKASALALREHPRANGSYKDGRLELHSRVNVGVAVAVQGSAQSAAEAEATGEIQAAGGALVVPTVFDADIKSLGEIASETRTLAQRVRDATITPPELGGGTFTVSNLGMFGVQSFTAIVNPPQAGILSVGALASRAVVRDGEIVIRNTMALTLACDHRILYGSDAAQFLARVRELLESPAALTL